MTDKLREATLCFLLEKEGVGPKRICLAMKKRGFGAGRWNGAGGKVMGDETIEETTRRETLEEFGVQVVGLTKVARLTFQFPHNPSWDQVVHVFITSSWEGDPQESEEMQPRWFEISDIPFPEMWPDDPIWLTQVLAGKNVLATFTFGEGDVILRHEMNLVQADEL